MGPLQRQKKGMKHLKYIILGETAALPFIVNTFLTVGCKVVT